MIAFEKPRFRQMSSDEAHMRQTVPAALCGRRVGDLVLRAGFPRRPLAEGPWFQAAPDTAFRIRRLGGRAVHMDVADGPAMARALDEADGLLSEIEAALGIALHPGDIAPLSQGGKAFVAVEAMRPDGDQADGLIELALSTAAALLPAPPPPGAAALLGHVPLALRLEIDGPRLPPQEAAALAPGDLLLIGAGPIPATIRGPGGLAIAGRIAPDERLFRPDRLP